MKKNKKPKLYSKEWRLNHLYKIVGRESWTWAYKLMTFKLNKAQELIRKKELELKKLKKYWKLWKYYLNLLKGRQIWGTTYKAIDFLDTALFYRDRTVMITAHKEEKMKEIFQKVKLAYKHIPNKIRLSNGVIWEKPKPKYDSQTQYYFEETNSWIKVTLDSRSWTCTDLHISELSFIVDAENMMNWTWPSAINANISIETTANGFNYYKNLWDDNSDWLWELYNIFISWFIEDSYRVDLEDWEVINLPKELQHLDFLDNEQKKWYLQKYKTLKKAVFQEFPTIAEESFISSWRPVFDMNVVKSISWIEWLEDSFFPEIQFFKEPGKENFFWVDVAEWLENWDYSTISVLNENEEQIAGCKIHIPPDQLPKVIDRIIKIWYKPHTWSIWIERNNHWLTVIEKCKDYPWFDCLYCEKTIDKITNKNIKKPWFLTTAKSKPFIIDMLSEAVRERLVDISDIRLIQELFTYFYDERGRSNAISPNHDDYIMSFAICLFVARQPKQTFIK